MGIETVQAVFREVFQSEDLVLTPETTARDVPEWDSFNHINLIMGLEMAFDISFSTDEIAAMANVGDLVKILAGKGLPVSW
jgi:acyl carrier protein